MDPRKKILDNRGLTLTELLVSSILMGIVMIGVAGFSVGIKRMQDTTDKQAIVAFHVSTAMAYFERVISQTYGSAADPTNRALSASSGVLRRYSTSGEAPIKSRQDGASCSNSSWLTSINKGTKGRPIFSACSTSRRKSVECTAGLDSSRMTAKDRSRAACA